MFWRKKWHGERMVQETITIKFDGQSHQVDLNTFSQVLMNYSAIIHACGNELNIGAPISIYVDATERGSLDVVLSAAIEGGKGLLSLIADNKDSLAGLKSVIETVTGLFKLKSWLGGKKKVEHIEQCDNDTSVIYADNQSITVKNTVVNVYVNQPNASEAINKTFMALEDNMAIEGLAIIKDGKEEFRADRDEFSSIAASPNYENEDVIHDYVDTVVTVVKPCFAGNATRSWRIVYGSTEIAAVISDENFIKDLSSYSFTRGTKMEVKLDITKKYDHQLKVYLDHKYTITNVEKVLNPPETPSMFE